MSAVVVCFCVSPSATVGDSVVVVVVVGVVGEVGLVCSSEVVASNIEMFNPMLVLVVQLSTFKRQMIVEGASNCSIKGSIKTIGKRKSELPSTNKSD